MTTQTATGVQHGRPGVRVLENAGNTPIGDVLYGTSAVVGHFKRGPVGVPVPVRTFNEYSRIFGDPSSLTWHLYEKAEYLTPDFVEDFFAAADGSAVLFVLRLALDNKGVPASVTLKNRLGADVLRLSAANVGRWGGKGAMLSERPIVVATPRTFTLVAPGVKIDEFVGADVSFTNVPGRKFRVEANTVASPGSGEVVFTLGAQYNLTSLGVSGPSPLSGTAAWSEFAEITGTVSYARTKALTGTFEIEGNVVVGDGSDFLSELEEGSILYYLGSARTVISITSDTTLTIDSPFDVSEASGVTTDLQTDNYTVTGTTTAFDTELEVGDIIYVMVAGDLQGRRVADITDATTLELESGFTQSVTAVNAELENYIVTGTGSAFDTELEVGDYLVDPYRAGETVRVARIDSATSILIDRKFSNEFTTAQLSNQTQLAAVDLVGLDNEGLAVTISQGRRYPETHFSLQVSFRGATVLRIEDASLDPADPLFVEDVVAQSNLAFSFDTKDHYYWIKAESLWSSDYTTAIDSDVRPANGYGKILELSRSRIYTISDLDYARAVGQQLYPSPYELPRQSYRIVKTDPSLNLAGTVSSVGTTVTGTATTFRSELKVGDYLYDPGTEQVRKIRSVQSDSALILDAPFSSNIVAGTQAKKAGFIEVNNAYDLTKATSVGTPFIAEIPERFVGGYDGDEATDQPYYYTQYADPDTNVIEKAVLNKEMGLVRMFTPGISGVEIQKPFAEYAKGRAFEHRQEIPSFITSAAAAESFVNTQLGRSDYTTIAFPSYGYKSNRLGAGYRLVSLSGAIAGGEARVASANRGWHVPFAGISAVLPNIIRLPATLEPSDQAILNLAGIQPILSVSGNVVVYGARTPSIREIYKFTHVRRIQSHYTRVFIEARSFTEQLFAPNQPGLADNLVMNLEQFAREEYRKGVITQYLPFRQAVEVSTALGTQSILADEDAESSLLRILNGIVELSFLFVPAGITEVIEITVGPQQLVEQYGQFS